ncbi:MAG TPA: tripartite tricarboxylate transporter substrate-binding protein [Burkholderiales bacterium]|nr:tripartite tricarboxylate transporter substrate-binding protein [Burkholderiales bacterium]
MSGGWKPQREIDILAGTPPGGGLDRTAHALLDAFTARQLLNIPARVVNIAGDGARKVWASVDARAGDARVLCISSPNLTTDYLTGLAVFSHDNYTPLAILYNEYIAFVTRSDSSYRSAGDLLKRLRDNAGKVTVALSTAAGNPNHIALAQVVRHAGGDVRAPVIRVFDSALDAVADVVAGNADIAAVTAASAVGALEAGTLRALAVSAPVRLAGCYTHTPVWRELGVPCTLGAWRGVHGAHALSADQIAYWESTLSAATRSPSWVAELTRHFLTPMLVTGAALREHLVQEKAQMAEMLNALGFSITK